jgi:hypothetical protein
MKKKLALVAGTMTTLIILLVFWITAPTTHSLANLACSGDADGIVSKKLCEAFRVKITFKNTGTTEGTWSVSIAFEGELWTWKGTPQSLTLKEGRTKTLTWNGSVPCNAATDSIARLIVYYNDTFVALNWWIHVVQGAELGITSSSVE